MYSNNNNLPEEVLNALFWGIKDTEVWKNSGNLFSKIIFEGKNAITNNVHPEVRGLYFLFLREREVYNLKKKLITIYTENKSWKRFASSELNKWMKNNNDKDDLKLMCCMFNNIDKPNAKFTLYLKNSELREYLRDVFEKKNANMHVGYKSYKIINNEGLEYPILSDVLEGYPKWWNKNYEKEERDEKFPQRVGFFIFILFIVILLFKAFA